MKMCDLKFCKRIIFGCAFLVFFTLNWNCADCLEIECVPLKSCPTALKLVLQSKNAPETIQFLKISHCGFDKKNQPKVWCSKLDFCVTPQDRNGTCTPLKKCKPFLQLRSTLDTSNPQVVSFLNKFRCHEILKEDHVCCQNEPFESRDYNVPSSRTSREQSNFYTPPPMTSRHFSNDYDYYDWPNDGPFDYTNHHDYSYFNNFGPPRRPSDYPNVENTPSLWHTPPDKTYERKPEINQWNNGNNHETSNNNKRGTSRDESHVYYETTPKGNRNYLEHTTSKGSRTRYDQVTPTSQDRRTTDTKDYDYTNFERTTPWYPIYHNNHNHNHNSREDTNNHHIHNPISNRDIDRPYVTTTIKKNRLTTPTPNTKRPTSGYGRTTTTDSTVDINEGDIIFEDRFDEITRKSKNTARTTTTTTSKPSSARRTSQGNKTKDCQTPDRKAGTCTRATNCQPYITLQNNLDRSKQSVRDYLKKFKCASRDEICCLKEEKTIDNSLFNGGRANDNVPEPIAKICGRHSASDRIVGGSLAGLGEFPWLALLQYPSNQGIQAGCGGSLINSRYVVTAAHCVDEQLLRNRKLGQVRQVVLGEYDTRNKTDCIYLNIGEDCADPPKTYRVESIIPHKLYSSRSTQNDIALLRLDQEVKFTDFIKPICLPTKSSTLKGNETFIIAGWGKSDITSTEVSSPVLRKAKVPYAKKSDCNTRDRTLIEGQICAGLGNGTDSCTGDSGGPLVLQVNFNFEFVSHLVGIISYGYGICGTGPSVNTYVPPYIDWIEENITP